MGELSASIAHDVNQPLSAIVANGIACQRLLAAASPDLEEARETLDDIISDGRRASAVVGRVRQLAKKATPELTPVDVNGAISEVFVPDPAGAATRSSHRPGPIASEFAAGHGRPNSGAASSA